MCPIVRNVGDSTASEGVSSWLRLLGVINTVLPKIPAQLVLSDKFSNLVSAELNLAIRLSEMRGSTLSGLLLSVLKLGFTL